MSLTPIFVPSVPYDPPGSVTFTSPGGANFTIPKFKTSLVIELWGAGGGGAGSDGNSSEASNVAGVSGTATTIASLSLSAGGGERGYLSSQAGGVASGGTTNTNGNPGSIGTGGSCPNGGVGGVWPASGSAQSGNPGGAPGGGGSGARVPTGTGGFTTRRGGGSGAYVSKTYVRGSLTPESVLSMVVGTGGAGGNHNLDGGAGGRGQIKITWT